MISFSKTGRKFTLSMSAKDLEDFAELVFMLKHTPPPIGFNRKPLTTAQQRAVDNVYDVLPFPDGYGDHVRDKTGQ